MSDSDPASERRRRIRRHLPPVPAAYACQEARGQGEVLNISADGVFIAADRLPAPASEIRVVLEAPESGKIEVLGRVSWTTAQLVEPGDGPSGFGVHIDSPGEAFLELFERILLG